MSTHNIWFHEEISNIILKLSQGICPYLVKIWSHPISSYWFIRVMNYWVFIIGICYDSRLSFICMDNCIDLSSCTNVFNLLGKLTGGL